MYSRSVSVCVDVVFQECVSMWQCSSRCCIPRVRQYVSVLEWMLYSRSVSVYGSVSVDAVFQACVSMWQCWSG